MQLTVFLVSLFAAIGAGLALTPPETWENINYERNIDLHRAYVTETHSIEIKNIGSKPNAQYYLAIRNEIVENLSIFVSSLSDQPVLALTEAVVVDDEDSGLTYYVVNLPIPISPKSTAQLKVTYAYVDSVEPIPAKISLDETQHLLLKTEKYPLSPYVTDRFTLNFLGLHEGRELHLETDQQPAGLSVLKGNVRGNALVFGPLEEVVPPFTRSLFGLHYDRVVPVTRVDKLNRDFWVSHWGNAINLEEKYEMTNAGAQLSTGFSRVDWLKGRFDYKQSFAITNLEIALPENTNEIYFTDLVGNVSTSAIRNNHLFLKPRFPVFGGWHYNFTVGWSNKLNDYVHSVPDSNEEYIMKVPLVNNINDIYYKEVFLSFYLPENAELLEIESPMKYEEKIEGYELSYLDVANGHVKVTLRYTNLIDDLRNASVLVKYRYTTRALYSKALTISAYVFVALLSYYLITKIDVSINKKKAGK